MPKLMVGLVACLLAIAPLSTSSLAADGPIDASTLARRISDATGPAPRVYSETMTSVSPSETVVRRYFQRGNDWRNVRDAGPFHTEEGSLRGTDWHQNENGLTIVDTPEPGMATPERYTVSIVRLTHPLDAWVRSSLNPEGYGSREYVDAATFRIVRREQVTPNGTIVTDYDDFRTVEGRTVAFHWVTTDPIRRSKTESRIQSYAADDVADAQLAIPPDRSNFVTFPDGVSSVELPAVFHFPHIYVRVTINGRDLDFILDTGASGIAIDSTVAAELGLHAYNPHWAVTVGSYATASSIVPTMQIGALKLHDVHVTLIPQGINEQDDIKVVGLLGFDFFQTLGVTIDYAHRSVTAVPASAFQPPPPSPGTFPWEVRLGEEVPMVTARVNGAVGERFIVDTGATRDLLVFDYFARRHPEAFEAPLAKRGAIAAGFGVGGTFQTQRYRMSRIEIGSLKLQDFSADRVMSKEAFADPEDGLIGPGILKDFTVKLDYANRRIYLTR